jgi:predicted nucleotidyltransferase/HEPN domain-containing protein
MTTASTAKQDVDAAVQEMVKIIVDGWNPLQIILFGSRARGNHHDRSDVDLLVVLDKAEDRRELGRQISDELACTGIARDIIISTPVEIVRQATVVGRVERAAIMDGRTLFVRDRGDPVMEQFAQLMHRANGDIRSSEAVQALEPPELQVACYHAQQAIEKAVKAALMVDRIDYPFTHELEQLLPLVPIGWNIDGIIDDPKELSTWATYPRYMTIKEPTPEFAEQAVADARKIYERVLSEMTQRGLPSE